MNTEIVDIESLDVGAIVLLGTTRREWRIAENQPINAEETCYRVKLEPTWLPEPGESVLTRNMSRTARVEAVCK